MGHNVYANMMAIVAKSADGKAICAFPDVCLSPPTPPAGPIPIPYPNTGFASDTTQGSKTVKLAGKEVALKNQSYFSKSMGDEAATKTLGMGVISHQITGKVYFNSWSMDVKIEGKNVCRHFDLTTHNHSSVPGNSPPWPYLEDMTVPERLKACGDEMEAVKSNCTNYDKPGKTHLDCPDYESSATKNAGFGNDPCVKAKRCMLVPYDRSKSKGGCCEGQTPHHLVPKRHFPKTVADDYDQADAPCVCAEGFSWHRNDASKFPDDKKTHPDMHDLQDATERSVVDLVESDPSFGRTPDRAMTYEEAREVGIAAHKKIFKDSGCSEGCLQAQLDAYHNQAGVDDKDPVATKRAGSTGDPATTKKFANELKKNKRLKTLPK